MISIGADIFFLNRAGTLYRYPNITYALPDRTVLDGEVIAFGSNSPPRFLAFDILGSKGTKVWHLPFDRRQTEIRGLLHEEIQPANTRLIVLKQYVPATVATITSLLPLAEVGSTEDFPSDGLVFTPRETPYRFGSDGLLVKWKPQQTVDLDANMIKTLCESLARNITVDTSNVEKWPFICQLTVTPHPFHGGRGWALSAGMVFECSLTVSSQPPVLQQTQAWSEEDHTEDEADLVLKVFESMGVNSSGKIPSHATADGSGWVTLSSLHLPTARQTRNLLVLDTVARWGHVARHAPAGSEVAPVSLRIEKVRFDKAQANCPSVIAKSLKAPMLAYSVLQQEVLQLQDRAAAAQLKRQPQVSTPTVNSKSFWAQDFDAVRNVVEAAVTNGRAERHESGEFQVYNSLGAAGVADLPWCRGLVLHLISKSVVTKPCFRFLNLASPTPVPRARPQPDKSSKNSKDDSVTFKHFLIKKCEHEFEAAFILLKNNELGVAVHGQTLEEQVHNVLGVAVHGQTLEEQVVETERVRWRKLGQGHDSYKLYLCQQ